MKTKPNICLLAKDLSVLAKKHDLTFCRFYPDGDSPDHLYLKEGRVLSYKEPAPKWKKILS